MQKINLRELYPDVYKTDVFVNVAEEVVAAIRGQEQDDAAYERRKFRHKAHYSLNREDGIENDALNRPLTPEEVLEQKLLRKVVCSMPSSAARAFICCTKAGSLPPTSSATATAASLAEDTQMALSISSSVNCSPGSSQIWLPPMW